MSIKNKSFEEQEDYLKSKTQYGSIMIGCFLANYGDKSTCSAFQPCGCVNRTYCEELDKIMKLADEPENGLEDTSMKMMECNVCGYQFWPTVERHYIARDDTTSGLSSLGTKVEPKIYDAFNCPKCGCQHIAQQIKRTQIAAKGNEQ